MQSELVIERVGESRAINPQASPALTRIHLWDLPIRIFHWSLVAAVLTAVVTGEVGGSWMGVHGKAGLTIIGLVAFRLAWGVIGSTHARFLSFAPSPAKIRAYFKGQWRGVGHNPLGAISVLALLGLLALQAGTGVFANDDIDFSGPLSVLVDKTLSNRLTGYHQWLSYLLLGLMALHVVAIIFYARFKKDNLVKPMVTGWKEVQSGKSTAKGGRLALIVAILVAAAAVFLASGGNIHTTPSAPSAKTTPAW